MSTDCCICNEIKSKIFPYSNTYKIEDRIIFEDKNFIAVPSVSPLADGHILIFPKIHINSILELQGSMVREAFNLTRYLYADFLADLGEYFIFEHGVSNNNETACGINHAHLHLLPLPKAVINNVIDKLAESYLFEKIDSLSGLAKLNLYRDKQYLLVCNGIEDFKYSINQKFESQTIRKIIAEELEQDNWDWKEVSKEIEFQKTHARFDLV